MKSLALGLVSWPGMDGSIKMMVKQCTKLSTQPAFTPISYTAALELAYENMVMCAHGLRRYCGRQLIVINTHLKWIEAVLISTATALIMVQQLRKLLAQFGVHDTIVSDNRSQFTAMEFQEFCRLNGIHHTKVVIIQLRMDSPKGL